MEPLAFNAETGPLIRLATTLAASFVMYNNICRHYIDTLAMCIG